MSRKTKELRPGRVRSMNMNWLGFSLSPREDDHAPISHLQLQSDQETLAARLCFNSNEIHGGTGGGGSDCFDLTNSDSAASLPASNFGMLEAAAFNRNNNNNHIHSQDWNMNSANSNNYKRTSSSDLSTMLMGSSTITSTSCSIISQANLENHHQQQQPKLENFLGQHSFADHDRSSSSHDYLFDMNNGPGAVSSNVLNTCNTSNNNIGLSMIKTWLRNQPSNPSDDQKQQLEQESNKNSKESKNRPKSSLSLSMSTGSLHTLTTARTSGGDATREATCSSENNPKQSPVVIAATSTSGIEAQTQSTGGAIEAASRKAVDTFGQRTSIYRGVTRHRWTGRYEAHLWDNSCRREGQTRKGRQVYLGGYDKEDKAARAYDLAALKYWGITTTTNFPITTYETEIDEMKPMTRQEYVASLRRKSSGFSRGASIYRGVTRHHQHGRWQARIGRVAGNKDLYLGTFSTQEEAAEAYDIAAIKFRGLNAVTNFDMSRYDVKSILESSALPITTGANAKRLKDAQKSSPTADPRHQLVLSSTEHEMMTNMYSPYGSYGAQQVCSWPTFAFNQGQAHQASATTVAAHPPHQVPFSAAGINGMQLHYSPYGYGYGNNNAHAPRVWCKQEQDTNSNHESSFHHQDSDHIRQQLQLGGTHNFFQDHHHDQQQSTGLIMGLTNSSAAASMEHSSGSNSVIYSSALDHHGNSYGYGNVMPMHAISTVVANDDNSNQNQAEGNNNMNGFGGGDDHQEVKQLGYDHHRNMFLGSSSTTDPDGYQNQASNRNQLYYHLPVHDDDQHESSTSIVAVATSSSTCNMNWVPTAVPTLTHPSFTVWNDT